MARSSTAGGRITAELPGDIADAVSEAIAPGRINQLIEATDLAFHDGGNLVRVVEQFESVDPSITQGRAFEFLEALKFNQEAAEAGNSLRAVPTHIEDSGETADILLQRGDDVVAAVQAKSYSSADAGLTALLNSKYQDTEGLVPADKIDELRGLIDRRLAELPDGPERRQLELLDADLHSELAAGGVTSGGTTRAEADDAVAHPGLVAAQYAGAAALREVGAAAAQGALVGGGTRAVFAAAANAIDVRRGRQSVSDAVVDTMRKTASAAIQGAAVNAGAQAIVIAARQADIIEFAGPAAPRQIAQSIWTVAGASRRYISGELDATAYRDEVGGEMTRRLAAYYCGVAGQLLLPVPIVGGLVGAVVGHATAGILLEAGLLAGGVSSDLAEARDRRARMEQECRVAIAHLEASRADIEVLVDRHASEMRNDILPALDRFDRAVIDQSPDAAINALVALSRGFRSHIPFRSLQEFDAFMLDEHTIFRL